MIGFGQRKPGAGHRAFIGGTSSSTATASALSEPPPARLTGTRAQAMQRLKVGLGGLASMLLLVGLANTIMQGRQTANAAGGTTPGGEVTAPASDPLVDIGVVPELPGDEVVVPDLPAEQMVPERAAPAPPAAAPEDDRSPGA